MGNEFGICLRDGRQVEFISSSTLPAVESPPTEYLQILPNLSWGRGDFFVPPSQPEPAPRLMEEVLSGAPSLDPSFLPNLIADSTPQPVSPELYQQVLLLRPDLASQPQAQMRTMALQTTTAGGLPGEQMFMLLREEPPPPSPPPPPNSGGSSPTPPNGGNFLPFSQFVPIAIISLGVNLGIQAKLNRELENQNWTSQQRLPVLFASSLATSYGTQRLWQATGFTGPLSWSQFGQALLVSRGATAFTIAASDWVTGNTSPTRNTVISIGSPLVVSAAYALGTRSAVQAAIEGTLIRSGVRCAGGALAVLGIPFLASDLTRVGMALYASRFASDHGDNLNFNHFAFSLEAHQFMDQYGHPGTTEALMPLIHLATRFRAPGRVGLALAQRAAESFRTGLEERILQLALENTFGSGTPQSLQNYAQGSNTTTNWSFDFDRFRNRLQEYFRTNRDAFHFFFSAYPRLRSQGFRSERLDFWMSHIDENGNFIGEHASREILAKILELVSHARTDAQWRYIDQGRAINLLTEPSEETRRQILDQEAQASLVNGHRPLPMLPRPFAMRLPNARTPEQERFLAPPSSSTPGGGLGYQLILKIRNYRLLIEALERAHP